MLSPVGLGVTASQFEPFQQTDHHQATDTIRHELDVLSDPALLESAMQKLQEIEQVPQSTMQELPANKQGPQTEIVIHNKYGMVIGTYLGESKKGIPEGRGTLTYEDSEARKSYTGEFVNGVPHGIGKAIYHYGEIYEGSWVDDKRHGLGTFIDAHQRNYSGKWKNDVFESEAHDNTLSTRCCTIL